MDPIQININVSLDLTDKTVSLIQGLLGQRAEAPAPQRKPATKPETKPEPRKPETKEQPEPEKPAANGKAPDPSDDLPFPAPEAPAEAKEEDLPITDEELRQVVFTARKAKNENPQIIKNEIFPLFGIKTSIECPTERRAELVAMLNKLIA